MYTKRIIWLFLSLIFVTGHAWAQQNGRAGIALEATETGWAAKTVDLQAEYAIELLPGQVFDGYWYFWANETSQSGALSLSPGVGWLNLSQSSFTSDGCEDIQPIRLQFTAPQNPGTYTTSVVDGNENWEAINVTLTVTTSPGATMVGPVELGPGQSTSLTFGPYTWSGFDMGCVDPFVPGPSTWTLSTYPNLPWVSTSPPGATLNGGESVTFEQTVMAPASGPTPFHSILEAQWFSFPGFFFWTFTAPPIDPPGVPQLAFPLNNATGISNTPTLSWNAPNEGGPVDTYMVQLSTQSDFPPGNVMSATTASTQHAPGELAEETTYHWRVKSMNAGGESNWSTLFTFTTAAATDVSVGSTGDEGDHDPNDGVCDTDPDTPGEQCTLRAGLEHANSQGMEDPIRLMLPPGQIEPTEPLPPINHPVVITSNDPENPVEIKGDNLPDGSGLVLMGGKSSVTNVMITGFPKDAIMLEGEGENVIDGVTMKDNGRDGVCIVNSSGNTVKNSTFSGNTRSGITIEGADSENNVIEGNKIGTVDGGNANGKNGVLVNGGSNARVKSNVISGNTEHGVLIDGGSRDVTVEENKIGVGEDGTSPAGNKGDGVCIVNASGATVKSNVLSGNDGAGVAVEGRDATGVTIEDNKIGVGEDGTSTAGNKGDGVKVSNASNTTVKSNVLSGNEGAGVMVTGRDATGVTIEDNKIGTGENGTGAAGNKGDGVCIDGASNTTLKSNVLSGNEGSGIMVMGDGSGNKFTDNTIGTDASGNEPMGNGKYGIHVENAPNTTLKNNVISGNTEGGIEVKGSGRRTIEGNKIGTNAAGEDPENKMGNGGNGIRARDAVGVEVAENTISSSERSGVSVENSTGVKVSSNTVTKNAVGVKIEGGGDHAVQDNKFGNNTDAGVQTRNTDPNKQILIGNNDISGTQTGIDVEGGKASAFGNTVSGNTGDGLKFGNGATADVNKNNIFGNDGFGVNNTDPNSTVNAKDNWWGDATGPSGDAAGNGDGVKGNVEYDNFRNKTVAVVATAEGDAVGSLKGQTDSVTVYVKNWDRPDDQVNFTVRDQRGWLTGPNTFTFQLKSDGPNAAKLPIAVPGSAPDGERNVVDVTVTSQTDPNATDAIQFSIVAQSSALAQVIVSPGSVTLEPGQTQQFDAMGLDGSANPVPFAPIWSVEGGGIDAGGLYTAGVVPGVYTVTATDAAGTVSGTASVEVVRDFSGPTLYLVREGPSRPGTGFVIRVLAAETTDLFGVAFDVVYTPTTHLEPVDAVPGDWIGSDVIFLSNVDAATGRISIGISRKAGQGGVSGGGEVARIRMRTAAGATLGSLTDLSLTAVTANDPNGTPLTLEVLGESVAVNVEADNTGPPDQFALHPAYPNPFNPAAQIPYDVQTPTHVRLTIYSVLGRTVQTVVDALQPAGRYTATFDAGNLPSGAYMARIEMGGFVAIQKMMLVK